MVKAWMGQPKSVRVGELVQLLKGCLTWDNDSVKHTETRPGSLVVGEKTQSMRAGELTLPPKDGSIRWPS